MVSGRLVGEPVTTVTVTRGGGAPITLSEAEAAKVVISVIRDGGLAVVPLDVSYAFLAGAAAPLQRIYELKLRPASKPCPVLASWLHFEDASADSSEDVALARRVHDAMLPCGYLTPPRRDSATIASIPSDCEHMLVKEGKIALFLDMGGMSDVLIAEADAHDMLLFGSSANISGQGNSFSIDEVPESFLDAVDIVCDTGPCRYVNPERLASTIVDLNAHELTRRGILGDDIEKIISQ